MIRQLPFLSHISKCVLTKQTFYSTTMTNNKVAVQQHVFRGDRYSKELQACLEIPDEKYWVCDISLEFFTTDIYILASVQKVLAGCGVYDGSEIHEASACLVHLSRSGAEVAMFAPDVDQMHVVDHTKGEPSGETRNVLVESARIARGKISALSSLQASNFDAVIFPGGFGAAKNLSTFAVDGTGMKVNVDVERVLKDFKTASKPIGLCCIAPVLAARVLPGCEVTVGSDKEEGGKWPYAGTAGAIQEMGAKHIIKDVTEAHVDTDNKVVTAPAYMCETGVHQVFDGIGAMVQGVIKLIK